MDHEENENEEEREDENGETKFLASVKGFFTNASNAQDTLSRNFSPKSKTNPAHNTNNRSVYGTVSIVGIFLVRYKECLACMTIVYYPAQSV